MSDNTTLVAHQFDDAEQQKSAATFGMWIFLLTEVMFFGGLFLAYIIYRHLYGDAFTQGSGFLNTILGTLNTAILITSSLTMVIAIHMVQIGNQKSLIVFLLLTILLGLTFLGIKVFEYYHDYELHLIPGNHFADLGPNSDHVELFFSLYFIMTSLHALHMVIGISIMLVITLQSWLGKYSQDHHNPIEMIGLYWHFVDIVWVFLFPLFYLINPHF